jgi:hypothetical protein
MLDKILGKTFAIAKVFSVVVILIAAIVCIINGASLVSTGASVDVPEYGAEADSPDREVSSEEVDRWDAENNDEAREDIDAMVRKYGLDLASTDIIFKISVGYRDHQDEFIEGFEDYLEEAQEAFEKKETDKSMADSANEYLSLYGEAYEDMQLKEIEIASKKTAAMIKAASAFGLVLAGLFLPLLIQIEKNTRAKPADSKE